MKLGIVLPICLALAAPSAAQRRNSRDRPLAPYNVVEVGPMTSTPKAVAHGFPVGLDAALRDCLIADLAEWKIFDKIIDGQREHAAGSVRPRQAEPGERVLILTSKIADYQDRRIVNLKSQIQFAALIFIPFAWTTSRATATASMRFEAEFRDPQSGQTVLKLRVGERCCGIRDGQVSADDARDYVPWKALHALAVTMEQKRLNAAPKRSAPARVGCPVPVDTAPP